MNFFIQKPAAIAIAATFATFATPAFADKSSIDVSEGVSHQVNNESLVGKHHFEVDQTKPNATITVVDDLEISADKGTSGYKEQHHGIYVGPSKNKAESAPDLRLEFGTETHGSNTNITVEKGGDTGILVDGFRNEYGQSSGTSPGEAWGASYTGDIDFIVNKNSTLNVKNLHIDEKPTSDAIELRVQDKGDGTKNNISIDFQGKGNIETAGGAGFYLLQSGKGDITVNLSEDVNVKADGGNSTTATVHMANHGINAVIQETEEYYKDQNVGNLNRGEIRISSGANISTTGDNASGIYARNLSGNVSITTQGTISAQGNDAHGINVRGSEGDIFIDNQANLELNHHENGQTAKNQASGIEVLVGQLIASPNSEKYKIPDPNKKYGNGTGTVVINNSGAIDAHGEKSYGIHVKRQAIVETPKLDVPAITVINSGAISLHKQNTHGISIESESVTNDQIVVENAGLITIDGDSSKGIAIDRTVNGTPVQVSRNSQGSDKLSSSIHVKNDGNIILNGNNSIGIAVKNNSDNKETVFVSNTGTLTLNGKKTTGIHVENKQGDVLINSQGTINITQPKRESNAVIEVAKSTPPNVNINGGEIFGVKATTTNGNIRISSTSSSNQSQEDSIIISGADESRALSAWIQGGTGDIDVSNTQNIQIEKGSASLGIVAVRKSVQTNENGWLDLKAGNVLISNSGDIKLSEAEGQSAGIVGWNDQGSTTILNNGNISIDGGSYTAGLIAHSESGNSQIIVANKENQQNSIDVNGEHVIGIRAHASGKFANELGQYAEASVINSTSLHVSGSNNKGIEAVADGIAYVINHGHIAMYDAEKLNSSTGLYAESKHDNSYIIHAGDIEAQNLKYGVHAIAGEVAHVFIDGNINVDVAPANLTDSFAIKSEGTNGNLIQVRGNITGAQAIKMTSGASATNTIDLHGTVRANNGYSIILDTLESSTEATGTTTVINHAGATLYGQISGKFISGESTNNYENRLQTDVINYGRWIVGDPNATATQSNSYNTTILGTQGHNSITNFGEMLMDPSLSKAVTWNQMGVKQFDNRGVLDLSSNKTAGDWLTITNNIDVSTNLERSGLEGTADYYKIKDRTHDSKFDGVFLSNGGRFDLDINLGDDNTGYADVLIVDNVRLEGAPTILSFTNRRDVIPSGEIALNKGIEVVHVRGTESNDAGAFVLGTTLTLNGYQYILEQDKEDKNWYIRNYLQDAGGPGEALIDPNAGVYLAGAWLNGRVFNHNMYDRRDSSWNKDKTLWARIEHNDGEGSFFNETQHSNLWSNVVQTGVDVYKKEDHVLGFYAAYGRTKADNHSPMTNTTAHMTADGYQVGAYYTFLPTNGDGAYVDLWGYWAWFDNKITGHAVNGNTVTFDSSGFSVSAETGYSWQPENDGFTIEPHVQVIYSNVRAKQANLEGTLYGGGKFKGFQTRLGARFFYDAGFQLDGAKLTPMLEANWLYNGAKDKVNAGPTAFESDIGRHIGELKLGWQGSMNSSWTSWGHVGLQRGSDSYENVELQVGLGYKF